MRLNLTLAHYANCVSVDQAILVHIRQEDDFCERGASETVDARLICYSRVSTRLKDKNGAKKEGMRRGSNARKKTVISVENNALDL